MQWVLCTGGGTLPLTSRLPDSWQAQAWGAAPLPTAAPPVHAGCLPEEVAELLQQQPAALPRPGPQPDLSVEAADPRTVNHIILQFLSLRLSSAGAKWPSLQPAAEAASSSGGSSIPHLTFTFQFFDHIPVSSGPQHRRRCAPCGVRHCRP